MGSEMCIRDRCHIVQMKIIKNSIDGIKKAAEILNGNGIVAFPTETVYGLAANAFSKEAVTKLYAIKRRPSFNPLIIHVSSYDMAREYGVFNDTADKLAKKYWPGPLTIVVKRKKSKVVESATAGLETIALRCPSNIVASKLIWELNKPIACLLYTSPSPRDLSTSRMPSSA